MGMAANIKSITDKQITASTSYGSYKPYYGRLWMPYVSGKETWCAGKKGAQEYLQTDFKKSVRLTGMSMAGKTGLS
jgi:hypothetical protein